MAVSANLDALPPRDDSCVDPTNGKQRQKLPVIGLADLRFGAKAGL
jgi:hypothetical protein